MDYQHNRRSDNNETSNQTVGEHTCLLQPSRSLPSLVDVHAGLPILRRLRLEEDVPFYSRPFQRDQHQPQILQQSRWGDLYWDVFYVSGAFNLASALTESLDGIGLLYFSSCFLAILRLWCDKCTFDGRYVIADNFSFRILELINYCFLGTAVQSIRPASIMSHTTQYPTMMVFCVSLVGSHFLHYCQDYDILMNCQGGPEAAVNARNNMVQRVPPCLLLILALILSMRDYFVGRHGHYDATEVNHWPAILIILAFVASQFSMSYMRYVITARGRPSHKESLVPLNLEHVIHRMGEWVTLLLGQSILALLVVEQSPGLRYYLAFYSGIITVTLFQYLYFRSNPFDLDDHAMRRSSIGAMVFFYGMILFSAALIMVGCSFKMILLYYLEEQKRLEQNGDEPQTIQEQTRQENLHAVTNLYSWSLAVSFVALDCILTSHRGIAANLSCLRRQDGGVAWVPFCLVVSDWGLTLCQATLSQWIYDVEIITIVGLATVSAQVLLRTRGLRHFPVSKQAMMDRNGTGHCTG